MTIEDLAIQAERFLTAGTSQVQHASWGLVVYRCFEPTEFEATVYDPSVCLIVQGAKQTTVGDQTVSLSEGQCVVVGRDLPVLSRIKQASHKRPYLSLVIRLDLEVLRALDDVVDALEPVAETPRSLEFAPASESVIDVFGRYLALMDDALGAKVLLPLVSKELHFRLLTSVSGSMLRALANRESHASNISRAIQQLREHFRDAVDVGELARSVGMSASLFHRHFKSTTMTTPLQYQKDLRLTEARRLLRLAGTSVSGAAFEVGYESPSQFSREYSRKFGAPPRADLQAA
jgi:AraC-like DNA-binding protein